MINARGLERLSAPCWPFAALLLPLGSPLLSQGLEFHVGCVVKKIYYGLNVAFHHLSDVIISVLMCGAHITKKPLCYLYNTITYDTYSFALLHL